MREIRIGVPPRHAFIRTKGKRDVNRHHVSGSPRLGSKNAFSRFVHKVHVERFGSLCVQVVRSRFANRLLAEIFESICPFGTVLCIPAVEALAIGNGGRLGLVQGVTGPHDLSINQRRAICAVEVVGGESRRPLGRHDIDGEVTHVEALRGGIGLAGRNEVDARAVVGHMVHAHGLALDAGIEEADVHGGIRLNDVARRTEERHVDGTRVLKRLAPILDRSLDGINHGRTGDLDRLHRGSLGQRSFGSGHFHKHVARLSVALERRAARVGFDAGGVIVFGRRFAFAFGSFFALDLRVGGYRLRSGVLGGVEFGFDRPALHLEGEVAGHLVGGNLVLAGLLVGGQLGFHAAHDGHHSAHLIARIGAGFERQLLAQGEIERLRGQHDVLTSVRDVRMREVQAHHGHAGFGGGKVGCRLGRRRDGRLVLRGRLGSRRRLSRGGRLGLGRGGGFGCRSFGGLARRIIDLSLRSLGRRAGLSRIGGGRKVDEGECHHQGHEDGQRLALERVPRIAQFLQHAHTYHRILKTLLPGHPVTLAVATIRLAHTFSDMPFCILDVVGSTMRKSTVKLIGNFTTNTLTYRMPEAPRASIGNVISIIAAQKHAIMEIRSTKLASSTRMSKGDLPLTPLSNTAHGRRATVRIAALTFARDSAGTFVDVWNA